MRRVRHAAWIVAVALLAATRLGLLAGEPGIAWEDLGVMVRGRTTLQGSPVLGFSTDKDGWSAYAGYRDHVVKRKPWAIVEVNLQTGRAKRFDAPPEERSDAWLFRSFPDGRPYTLPGGDATEGARIARLDWKTGRIQVFGPCPDPWNYCWQWGAQDAAIYIGGYRKGYAIRFDPETGEISDYGRQGREDAGPALSIAADDRFVYTVVGKAVSCLVACDRTTRKQTILGERRHPEGWSLNSWDGQVFARVQPPIYEDGKPKWAEYLVRDGGIQPIPERPPRRSPEGPQEAFGRPRPELLANSATCQGDGHATVWYRDPGQAWKSMRFPVDDMPSYLFRLGEGPAGRLIGSSEDPYNLFAFDPRTGEKALIGPSPNTTHIYDFLAHPNGTVYMCGYSGAPLLAWDPAKPWSFIGPTPDRPLPDWKAAGVNPLQVARMYRQRRAYRLVPAADGRIYAPCSAYVETIPGGGLGWYDPARDEAGLVREGFETWRGNDACAAFHGRYVVVTTVPWPHDPKADRAFTLDDPHDLVATPECFQIRYRGPEGETGRRITPEAAMLAMLKGRQARTVRYDPANYAVVFDTRTQRIARRVALGAMPDRPDGLDGRLCEWRPGKVVVRVLSAKGGRFGLLDLSDAAAGDAASRLAFPLEVLGAPHGRLLRLSDGRLLSLHQGDFVVVNPEDWTWKRLGRLQGREPGQEPPQVRDWLVLGEDLYLACDMQLARVRGIVRLAPP